MKNLLQELTELANNAPKLPQQDGVLVLNKPKGLTSARCLSFLKRLGQKKIGHAGTLDPMASGVLLVLLGQATKISSYLLDAGQKIYSGSLQLGIETDTWDIEGNILTENSSQNSLQNSWQNISADKILAEIKAWESLQEQKVPPYSAAKHQGRPLYKLARMGQDVPTKIKRVTINEATLLKIDQANVDFRVVCSSGTYIRSLVHSLGQRLGCGAILTALTREYSYPFGIEASCELATLLADVSILAKHTYSIDTVLADWPKVTLTAKEALAIKNGCPLPCLEDKQSQYALLMADGLILALAEKKILSNGTFWTCLRGLWNTN